ncbi:carbonic anhydrase family protein [Herbaspirillum rhizosphaerae]|uniref:Carbonic anhydrase n=1 Tax=Herbaspirillum rhizosphaerae TaxID=346179 RepID=A0ABW8ZCZ5_9BURK
MKSTMYFFCGKALHATLLSTIMLAGTGSAAMAESTHFDYAHQAEWNQVHGDRQSPIALDVNKATPDLDDDADDSIRISGRTSDAVVVDNTNTIQVNVLPGNFATIRGRRFQLQQFHFHTPSEHVVNGKRYPLELHLVYKAKNGRLAVIGVLFQEGAVNPAFDAIMRRVIRAGRAEPMREFDISQLLPANLSYFHYLGSLTTPPLSQNVEWHVLPQPITLSSAQLDDFHRYYTANSRALQPRNDREVLYHQETKP